VQRYHALPLNLSRNQTSKEKDFFSKNGKASVKANTQAKPNATTNIDYPLIILTKNTAIFTEYSANQTTTKVVISARKAGISTHKLNQFGKVTLATATFSGGKRANSNLNSVQPNNTKTLIILF
jgi:hypothetical protein